MEERKYHSSKPSILLSTEQQDRLKSSGHRKRNLLYIVFVLVIISFLGNTIFLFHHIDKQSAAAAAATVDVTKNKKETKLVQSKSQTNINSNDKNSSYNNNNNDDDVDDHDHGLCAILLFGLPRAFQQYVLPSMITNIIKINAKYGCDYYVHYYHIDREISNGRSGRGGKINPGGIQKLLPSSIHEINQNNTVIVSITYDTNETFWKLREKQIMKYRNTRNKDGTLTYFPYTEPTYVYPGTIDNIVKQWHSIDAVWNEMNNQQHKLNKSYKRVAMMRNDVVYITPIDLYKDQASSSVVIPNFAKYPINDRLIIGPRYV
jgi:hypothetical protein